MRNLMEHLTTLNMNVNVSAQSELVPVENSSSPTGFWCQ